MKKYVKTMRNVVTMMLSVAMVISILQTVAFRVVAAEEITLDFIPTANETAEDTTAIGTTATIKGTSVKIYEDLYYGAPGVEVAVAENTGIDLITAYEFSNGAVVYRFDYWGSESPELYNAVLDYCFIAAADIIVAGEGPEATTAPEATATPEVTPVPTPTVAPTASPEPTVAPTATPVTTVAPTATPAPTVEPTATPEATETPEVGNSIVDYGSMSKTMYIASNSLTLYKNHIDDVENTSVSSVKNEKVKVYFYYELSDGTVKYKVEYSGRNRSLKSAIASGYEFIKSDDLSATKGRSTASFWGWSY